LDKQPTLLCIVGSSGSGKTTLLEALVPLLQARGLAIGTIKHTHHDLDADHHGKDTWRHAEAGAEQVVLVASSGVAYFDYRRSEPSVEDVAARFLGDADLVLIEGYKWSTLPKIEVFRHAVSDGPMCLDDPSLVAIVTEDESVKVAHRFAPSDAEGIADFVVGFVQRGVG
jgi:molybdopterin-guanine dinucleotide biosynthesis protein B